MKKVVGLIIIVAALWTTLSLFNTNPSDVKGTSQKSSGDTVEALPKIGFRAPGFKLPSLDGQTYSLVQAKGKPLVINFWNTWCGPCKLETPELVKLYDKYQGEFQLYGVNLTNNDSIPAIKQFVQTFNMTYPVLLDKKGTVGSKYQVVAIPTTYFVNAKGIIVDKIIGYGGPGKLTEKVKALIKENSEDQ